MYILQKWGRMLCIRAIWCYCLPEWLSTAIWCIDFQSGEGCSAFVQFDVLAFQSNWAPQFETQWVIEHCNLMYSLPEWGGMLCIHARSATWRTHLSSFPSASGGWCENRSCNTRLHHLLVAQDTVRREAITRLNCTRQRRPARTSAPLTCRWKHADQGTVVCWLEAA